MKLDIIINRKELDDIVKAHIRNAVPNANVNSVSYVIKTMGGGTYRDNEKIGVEAAPIILQVEVEVNKPNDGPGHKP